jgi:putative nucleotidyltransferase with HDIG domain
MSAEVFTNLPEPLACPPLDLERLQLHAHAVATVAQALTVGTSLADDALLAALLHDIGYLVLMQECPRELEQAVAMAVADRIPLYEAEERVIGATHADIGAYLLGLWGLPCSVVEAVAHHHAPQRVAQAGFDVLAVLAIAGGLAPSNDADAFPGSAPPDAKVGPVYLESLRAPFGWPEAERRAAECLTTGNAIA